MPGSAAEVPVPARDSGMNVHELFADRAGETPDKTAMIAGPTAITYGELAERANQTARHLLDTGAGPDIGPVIAVVFDRPVEVLVGVLAVLAAGRAYTVLDPGAPMGELDRLLARAGAGAVITREEFRPRIESPLIVCVDTDAAAISAQSPEPPEAPENATAAVLFSTGTRRAVDVSHTQLRAAYDAWAQVYELDPADVHLVTAPPDTVAFTGGWVRALCSGATLALPEGRPDLAEDVTVLDTDPETAATLLGALPGESLRLVVVSGARLTLDRQVRLAPGTRVLNMYGPAEVAGCGTWFEPDQLAEPEPEPMRVSLLGRPFPGCRVDVHDGEIRLSPPGGGDPVPTGDAGFLRADGVLEFRGRLADRVTTGRRTVDPYPAESALGGHPAVAEAVITAGDGNRLVAYVAPRPRATAPDTAAVRAYLTGMVAENEIPDAVVSLPALPRDRTGKADRAALPRPPRNAAPASGKGGGTVRPMDFAAVLRWILLPAAALFAAAALTDVLWPGSTDVTAVPAPWSGLFRGLYAAEWLAFAAGVTFLVNGRPMMARQGRSPALTTAAHLAIVWLLVSWWPQDNFYRLAAKTDWPQQAALVYVFNVSLMVAGLLVAIYAARRPRATE